MKARREFSFKGRDYASGQMFQIDAIEAVQMGPRNVSYSSSKVRPEPLAAPPVRTRRRKTMANPDAGVEVSIQANPSAEPVSEATYSVANTYERKDLRAED